jgi:hypothetical protein
MSNEAKLEALLEIVNSSARQAIAEYKKTGHGVPSADSTTFHPLDLATDTVGLKKAIRLLEGAYHQLSAILAPPHHTVLNVCVTWSQSFSLLLICPSSLIITIGHAQTLQCERALQMF